VSGSLE